jgi:hypothetical protein
MNENCWQLISVMETINASHWFYVVNDFGKATVSLAS